MKNGRLKISKENIILRKIITFETIQEIMNPHLPSFDHFLKKKWEEHSHDKKENQFMVNYFGVN